jgi:DNA-directed RNA polymerase I, II, and III subunit RPABC2
MDEYDEPNDVESESESESEKEKVDDDDDVEVKVTDNDEEDMELELDSDVDEDVDMEDNAQADINPALLGFSDDNDDVDNDYDDDEPDENYLQKFDNDMKQNIIADYHPELNSHSMEEVEASCVIVRDERGIVIDPMHRTVPFVTRYERARVIGERAKQINSGAKPFVEIEQSMIDGYLIALKEFEEKKIPFIIRRPMPNGSSEYWRLSDLEIVS